MARAQGCLIGLRLVADNPDRFARVIIGNTGLPTGEAKPSDAFMAWQKLSLESPVFPIGQLLDGDSITAGGDRPFRKLVSGAQGEPHTTITGAHHFFQEDAADQIATVVIDAIHAVTEQ
ncbi:MAG: hypothetical protein ABIP17_10220 [Ilumatobacteraceae bacterium]